MSETSTKWILSLLSSTMLFAAPAVAFAEEEEEQEQDVEEVTATESSEDFEMTIFHTNDIHASIDDFGRLSYYLNEQRDALDNTLYLDAGDIFSGNPVVDLQDGEPLINLLNAVNLDLMTIGNHEFDYGQHVFQYRRDESEFNWISANTRVVDPSIPIAQPDPYEIFEFGEFTVGVLGLTESPPATNPAGLVGLEFDGYTETALEYEHLRDVVDIFIALTHIGIAADRRLAEEVEFFDLIIGGHSHTTLSEPEVVNGTPIAQAGSNARNVGVLNLLVDGESGEVSVDGRLQPVSEVDGIDENVQSMVDQYNEETEELLSEVLGLTNTGLNRDDRWLRDVALGNMITDAIRTFANTDIAITNNGGIRASIAAGDITARDIFTVDPFGNHITILEMTGHELQEVIAYSFHRSLNSYGPQVDLQTSGLNYIIYTDDEGLYADSDLFINGEPMDMDQRFRIATNNFIVTGGDGYDFSSASIITEDAGQVTNALIQYVQDVTAAQGAVDYDETEGRIQVLPLAEQTPEVPVDDEEDTDDPEVPEEDEEDLDDEVEEEEPEVPAVPVEDDNDEEVEVPEVIEGDQEEEGTVVPAPVDLDDEYDDVDSEEEATEEEEGERLPETATLTWTIGLAGLGSAAAGATAHFIKKKK
jgi:2',3'-cyclic-nucleotide 2'-phosphodiesterase (5'-nucleotidase family)